MTVHNMKCLNNVKTISHAQWAMIALQVTRVIKCIFPSYVYNHMFLKWEVSKLPGLYLLWRMATFVICFRYFLYNWYIMNSFSFPYCATNAENSPTDKH